MFKLQKNKKHNKTSSYCATYVLYSKSSDVIW